MKTIFITISRGLLVRNILRNKCFEILKNNKNLRVVLLFFNIFNLPPPEYLQKELGGENVIFEFVPNKARGRLTRLFLSVASYLVYTRSSWMLMRGKIEAVRKTRRSSVYIYILRPVFLIFSKLNFLKTIARRLWLHFFQDENFSAYFEKYKPDLVFSTFILSNLDIEMLKQAKKRGIKTIAMPKSWDNLDKLLFMVEPDIFLVQNNAMEEQTKRYQAMKSEIKIVGFPQFDIYRNSQFISKEEYCLRKGFDPRLPILFLGSEGKWSEGDESVFGDIIASRAEGGIPSCNILMRPHFSVAPPEKYAEFKAIQNVYIDNNFRHSDFFGDGWDPTAADYEDFANSLFHCNVMVTFASTLTLDATYFDKPIILVDYGIKHGESEKVNLYKAGHYEQVMDERAVHLASTKEEVASAINIYLKNPEIQREERTKLRQKMCGELDGRAGERIANTILDLLNK